jgi:hypothetical protein
MEHPENRWPSPTGLARVRANVAAIPSIGQIVAYRTQKQESQRHFWARFGVTQSRGSRFESGAEIPAPVSILLALYFSRAISDGDLGGAWRMRSGRDPAGSTSRAL